MIFNNSYVCDIWYGGIICKSGVFGLPYDDVNLMNCKNVGSRFMLQLTSGMKTWSWDILNQDLILSLRIKLRLSDHKLLLINLICGSACGKAEVAMIFSEIELICDQS